MRKNKSMIQLGLDDKFLIKDHKKGFYRCYECREKVESTKMGFWLWHKCSMLIGLILLLVVTSCDTKQQEGLPPQYGMLCNQDSTKFVATMPGGTKLYKKEVGFVPFSNYQSAIERAWGQYNYKPDLPDTTSWQKCGGIVFHLPEHGAPYPGMVLFDEYGTGLLTWVTEELPNDVSDFGNEKIQ